MSTIDRPPPELVLGTRLNSRVPEADQKRQRAEVEEILRRLCGQPGVILADEVGMGKTFVDLMKLLDDVPRERCHLIFLAQGAMSRRQTDKWVRLALIAETLRRHGRGKAKRLIQVRHQIHRFLAELLGALGEE